jgi:hypothetical protein
MLKVRGGVAKAWEDILSQLKGARHRINKKILVTESSPALQFANLFTTESFHEHST